MKRGVDLATLHTSHADGAANVTLRAKRREDARAPSTPPVSESLLEVDRSFHVQYDAARGKEEFAAPVLVVLADSLVLFRAKTRRVRRFGSPKFHVHKIAAHALVAVFTALFESVGQPVPVDVRRALKRTLRQVRHSLACLSPAAESHHDLAMAFASAGGLIDQALEDGVVSRRALKRFAATGGRLILRLTEEATRVQLGELHRAVEAELAVLRSHERRAIQVVVAGDHQARSRSLAMQYFQKRFGEAEGTDQRVTYAEGLHDPGDGPRLVGKRRLDRILAEAFFGDPNLLQQDVLGGATESLLRRARLRPIR